MNKDCFIAEDLLPLYNEGLLQDETVEWLESHLATCENCRELAEISKEPVAKEQIESTIDNEKMFRKINLKLSVFQMIFVGISFFFAIRTALLNESFAFILSYTILGLVTYLFYRSIIIVISITFIPIFLWSMIEHSSAVPAITIAGMHLLFAVSGSLIGLLILKIRE